MIPERYLNFLSEISGKFLIGNFGKLPRPIPTRSWMRFRNAVTFYKHLLKRSQDLVGRPHVLEVYCVEILYKGYGCHLLIIWNQNLMAHM